MKDEKPVKVFWKTKKGLSWKKPSQGFSRKPLTVFHSYEKSFRGFLGFSRKLLGFLNMCCVNNI
jgi:hypothetical protein